MEDEDGNEAFRDRFRRDRQYSMYRVLKIVRGDRVPS